MLFVDHIVHLPYESTIFSTLLALVVAFVLSALNVSYFAAFEKFCLAKSPQPKS